MNFQRLLIVLMVLLTTWSIAVPANASLTQNKTTVIYSSILIQAQQPTQQTNADKRLSCCDSDVDGLTSSKITSELSQNTVFDNKLIIANFASSLAFRNLKQTDPEFFPLDDLKPNDFSNRSTFSDDSQNLIAPWFMHASQSTNSSGKNRLSGWKDGSFLYTACITYH